MSQSEWVWDDPSIKNEETIYRHIPCRSEGYTVADAATEETFLTKKAFQINDHPDGWSVFRRSLMTPLGLTLKSIEESHKDGRNVWETTVGEVRSPDLGIVDSEDPELGDLGKAHAVLRLSNPSASRGEIRAVRGNLVQKFRPAQPF